MNSHLVTLTNIESEFLIRMWPLSQFEYAYHGMSIHFSPFELCLGYVGFKVWNFHWRIWFNPRVNKRQWKFKTLKPTYSRHISNGQKWMPIPWSAYSNWLSGHIRIRNSDSMLVSVTCQLQCMRWMKVLNTLTFGIKLKPESELYHRTKTRIRTTTRSGM